MPIFHVSNATRACRYTPDGKCVGMLNNKLYIDLPNAFPHARDSSYHNQVMPPPKDLNSELVLLPYKSELRLNGGKLTIVSCQITNLRLVQCQIYAAF